MAQDLTIKNLIAYLKRLDIEFRYKWFWKLAIFAGVLFAFSLKFAVTINLSYSLPGTVYLIVKNPQYVYRGDMVAYKYYGLIYPKRTPFMKIVKGVHKDTVTAHGREYFVNGQSVGMAKEKSLAGSPLMSNHFTGVIPPGKLWVSTPDQDSLDSRYEDNGLISEGQVYGKAYKLW